MNVNVFEFYFNPKADKSRRFETFSFEPQNKRQEAKGNLYVAGMLENTLPVNATLLKSIALAVRDAYYKNQKKTKKSLAEESLQVALRKANQLLKAQSKKGNVQWLGNLHIVIFALVPERDETFKSYVAKYGKMRV